MVGHQFTPFFLVMASLVEARFDWRTGFLGKYDVTNKRLNQVFGQHRLDDSLKAETLWFEQKLDHFNPANTKTWQQQYAANTTVYNGNGVAFLYIQGESQMSAGMLYYSNMADNAVKYGAAMFVVEHRFYGKSRPTPDLSLDSLKYLSSEQALADLAYFITRMNVEHGFSNPKWVVFGGSYAGSLAAWLRYKYPHLVYAAVSSSGPLEAKLDYPEYLEVVSNSLATVNPDCPAVIKAATQEISKGFADEIKRGEFREIFSLCEPLEDNEKDRASFFQGLIGTFAMSVQGNAVVDYVCNIMTNSKIKCPVKRYARAFKYMTFFYDDDCFDHRYYEGLEMFDESRTGEYYIWRQWFYQTCTEFGFYQTSSDSDQTFGDTLPLKWYTGMCADVYGPKFNETFLNRAIDETNVNYGAMTLGVEKVIFVHGSLDPWNPLGIKSNPPQGSYAIFINGSSHCADTGPESEYDPPELKQAKLKISEIIGDLLSGKKHLTRKPSIFHF